VAEGVGDGDGFGGPGPDHGDRRLVFTGPRARERPGEQGEGVRGGAADAELAVLAGQGATTADAMTYAALIDRYIFGSGLQEAEEARMSRTLGLDDEAVLRSAMWD
jgi:hypothetical protein